MLVVVKASCSVFSLNLRHGSLRPRLPSFRRTTQTANIATRLICLTSTRTVSQGSMFLPMTLLLPLKVPSRPATVLKQMTRSHTACA